VTERFYLFGKVHIVPLDNLPGIITGILENASGFQYEVRYFHECDAKYVYFFPHELEPI
jgi:hypothetical protein